MVCWSTQEIEGQVHSMNQGDYEEELIVLLRTSIWIPHILH
jgi:hypothetical protein